ncbi:MAG: flavodoxin-dependent (E)-4-hydroxy-3-methylbut-2-enyl-diphosphate synthase [Elusimicrobia bacterium]|nr:flavodoxin-dependent (E)-4-hydroxy-3-methylbut-2-enyl-diphosphate synthase [Candidatus Liberimonas magnetica]
MFKRWQTRKVNIGKLSIGGGSPVLVQSMTNTKTSDVNSTVSQIKKLEDAGCDIVRVSVPDLEAARSIEKIKNKIKIPLVCDIHFDYKLAIESIKRGADKIRINPGNIGSVDKVQAVVEAAKKARIPIRIGVNAGSLKKAQGLDTYKKRAEVLAGSALEHIKLLEKLNFYDTVVALKASDVLTTIEAYRVFASKKNYPLHIGISESGSVYRGTIKSSVGLGVLLYMGLGDTLRVSLTGNPVDEVQVGYHILQTLGLRSTGIDMVSCPTCSRCEVDLIKIVNKIEDEIKSVKISSRYKKKPLKVAVMGCVVNGPGEAKESDFGIAGGKNSGLLFVKGKIIKRLKPKDWVKTILKLIKEKNKGKS